MAMPAGQMFPPGGAAHLRVMCQHDHEMTDVFTQFRMC